jgi:hypothetical protein
LMTLPAASVVEADNPLDVVPVVDQADVASDHDIAVAARGRRQLTYEIVRRRVHSATEMLVENDTFTETALLVRREAVLVPEAHRRVIFVLVVPVPRHLLVMIVKPVMVPLLGESHCAGKGEHSCRRNGQPECLHLHRFLLDC